MPGRVRAGVVPVLGGLHEARRATLTCSDGSHTTAPTFDFYLLTDGPLSADPTGVTFAKCLSGWPYTGFASGTATENALHDGERVRLFHLVPGRYQVCANPGNLTRFSTQGLLCRDVLVTPGAEETVTFDDKKEWADAPDSLEIPRRRHSVCCGPAQDSSCTVRATFAKRTSFHHSASVRSRTPPWVGGRLHGCSRNPVDPRNAKKVAPGSAGRWNGGPAPNAKGC